MRRVASAREVVARFADSGYVQLKIYSSMWPSLVPFLAELLEPRDPVAGGVGGRSRGRGCFGTW